MSRNAIKRKGKAIKDGRMLKSIFHKVLLTRCEKLRREKQESCIKIF
jgi:hypothetical protein